MPLYHLPPSPVPPSLVGLPDLPVGSREPADSSFHPEPPPAAAPDSRGLRALERRWAQSVARP